MKKISWKEVAEILGITSIVASLIFVGLQLKQSQEIAIAAQYQARTDTIIEFFNVQKQHAVGSDWRIVRDGYRPSFQEVVDKMMLDNESDSP